MIKKIKHVIKRKQFIKWTGNYLTILTISLIVSMFIFYVSQNILSQEVEKNNSNYLSQVKEVLDMNLSNIENFSFNIMNTANIGNLMNNKSETSVQLQEWTSSAITDLKAYSINLDFVSTVHIIFRNRDICIDNSAKYSRGIAYDLWYKPYFQSQDAWENMIFSKHVKDYLVLSNEATSEILFIQTFPILGKPNADAVIIVHLNKMDLVSFLQKINRAEDNNILIFDTNGNALLSAKNNIEIPSNIMNSEPDIMNFNMGSRQYVISRALSNVNSWQYSILTPEELYTEKVNYIRNITFFGYFFLLLTGIALALLFSHRQYKPLENIVSKIQAVGLNGAEHNTVYSYIDETITKLSLDKIASASVMKSQNEYMKRHLLSLILKGRVISNINKKTAALDIHFQYNAFTVVLFNIMELGSVDDGRGMIDWDNYTRAQFLIANVFEELLTEYATCHFCDVDDMYVCIVNSEDGRKDTIFEKTEYTIHFLARHLGLELVCAISDTCDDEASLPELYDQAVDAIRYRFIESQKIIRYDCIQNKRDLIYEYSIQEERKLINSIATGDFALSKEMIEHILEKNLENKALNINMIKSLIYEISCTILKTTREYGNAQHEQLWSVGEVLRLLEGETIGDIVEILLTKLRIICDTIDSRRNTAQKQYIDTIYKIIETRYTDINLGTAMIAEEIKVSPNYLSSYFADKTGGKLSEYITQFRIDKAKKLLSEEEIKIGDIANSVGFYNANVFIRAFKKAEGITPGQFRKIKEE